MLVRPLHDRVVIKRMEEERKTASGIVIPDSATEKPDHGVIVAVGTGRYADDGKLIPMTVKVGEKVLFGKQARQTFKIEGEEYITMHEEEIIGVIET
ncbi:co-chaperone GroES [Candidatus Nitrotoga sp. M5]|uniref:co-chaperone GroES n=1 Tax=Candidatus Nitrotoga sp. M5 TaxID=2890409 RepID=UPI001EF23AFD|nr:co-chaperone GroES [Candidatus Nitrotoga sp. M5]CAH1385326.1 cochaperonin GroES [Candidatus Nitrotoga sp. M5]